MLRHIAAFEWRYQLRNPVLWVGALLFLVSGFGATVSDYVQIGSAGSFHKNSPYALLQATGVMGLFVTFVTVALVAGAVLRDDETGFAALLHATPLRKFDLLVGRFAGAVAAALVVVAATPLGILLGTAMPGLDAERFGPTLPGDYLYAIFLFGLPTLLVTAAAYFAVAASDAGSGMRAPEVRRSVKRRRHGYSALVRRAGVAGACSQSRDFTGKRTTVR